MAGWGWNEFDETVKWQLMAKRYEILLFVYIQRHHLRSIPGEHNKSNIVDSIRKCSRTPTEQRNTYSKCLWNKPNKWSKSKAIALISNYFSHFQCWWALSYPNSLCQLPIQCSHASLVSHPILFSFGIFLKPNIFWLVLRIGRHPLLAVAKVIEMIRKHRHAA